MVKPPLFRFVKLGSNIQMNSVSKKRSEYLKDCMTIHGNSVDFLKQATQYMFLANGVAVTTLLVKVDMVQYMPSLVIFCGGMIYSIFLLLFMHFRSISSVIIYLKTKEHPLTCFHTKMIFRIFSLFLSYVPSFVFAYGIYTVYEITNNIMPKDPLALLVWISTTLFRLLSEV